MHMLDSPLVVNPIISNICALATVGSVLGFTSANSLVRTAVLPILLLWTWAALPHSRNGVSRKIWAFFLASNLLGQCLQYTDMALLSRWSYETDGPTSALGGQRNLKTGASGKDLSTMGRVRFSLFTTWAARLANTPWEVKNTPPFRAGDTTFVPSRRKFLCHTALKLTACILIIDIVSLLPVEPAQNSVLFSGARVPLFARLRDVTGEEVVIRVGVALSAWVINYCILEAIYDTLAVVFVTLGLTGVSAWRPIFGNLKDCRSLRRFWGSFWQQAMRQRLTGPAHFITYHALGLPKGTAPSRYIFLLLTFVISGIFHALADVGTGLTWSESGSLRFFVTQALGIMIEDGVQAVFHSWRDKGEGGASAGIGRLLTRYVGHCWVALWMCWSGPAWFYPQLRHQTGGEWDKLLPFSILETFFGDRKRPYKRIY